MSGFLISFSSEIGYVKYFRHNLTANGALTSRNLCSCSRSILSSRQIEMKISMKGNVLLVSKIENIEFKIQIKARLKLNSSQIRVQVQGSR